MEDVIRPHFRAFAAGPLLAALEDVLRPLSVLVIVACLAPANVFASDHHHHHHHHSSGGSGSGGGCGGHDESESASSHSTSSSPTPAVQTSAPSKRVFVTRELFSADLGGLEGADARCAAAASKAGLAGTYRAWLSSGKASIDAIDRLSSSGPWKTTSGAVAFADKPDQFGPPVTDLLDETGESPVDSDADAGSGAWAAWSGSDANGRRDGLDCSGWSSTASSERAAVGNAKADDVQWGGGKLSEPCSGRAALICFEQ